WSGRSSRPTTTHHSSTTFGAVGSSSLAVWARTAPGGALAAPASGRVPLMDARPATGGFSRRSTPNRGRVQRTCLGGGAVLAARRRGSHPHRGRIRAHPRFEHGAPKRG